MMKANTRAFLSLLLFAVVLCISPSGTSAHGEGGRTFTGTTTKGRIVDVDYSDTYIEADRIGRFDFNLFTDDTREKAVNFSDLWVRILKNDGSRVGKTLYAGGVAKQEFGKDGFSFVFPEAGTYTLSVRYNDSNEDTYGETVGEATFELEVLRSEDENTFNFGIEFLMGLMAGFFGAVIAIMPFVMRSKKN